MKVVHKPSRVIVYTPGNVGMRGYDLKTRKNTYMIHLSDKCTAEFRLRTWVSAREHRFSEGTMFTPSYFF